jgi:carboxylesterase
MKPLARAFAAAGFAVELPLLPGHGTTPEELAATSWADWSGAVEQAHDKLAARCERVVVAGLSMGGTLAVWLASRRPDLAGLVLVNPLIDATTESFVNVVAFAREAGEAMLPGVGSDIARPGVVESAYEVAPAHCFVSLAEAVEELAPRLADVRCPMLLCTSANDHVVDPVSSDTLAAAVSGPVERVSLERSFHVATLDWDQDVIEERAVEFARRVT